MVACLVQVERRGISSVVVISIHVQNLQKHKRILQNTFSNITIFSIPSDYRRVTNVPPYSDLQHPTQLIHHKRHASRKGIHGHRNSKQALPFSSSLPGLAGPFTGHSYPDLKTGDYIYVLRKLRHGDGSWGHRHSDSAMHLRPYLLHMAIDCLPQVQRQPKFRTSSYG